MAQNKLLFLTLGCICFFWLVFNASPVPAARISISSQEQFDFAMEYMEQEEYLLAVGELKRFVHFFPDNEDIPRAWYLIGTCRVRLAQYQKAAEAFSRVFRSGPDQEIRQKTMLAVGNMLTKQGKSTQAEDYYRQLLKRDLEPEVRGRVLYRLGWTELEAGRWQEASSKFNRVPEKSDCYQVSRDLADKSLQGASLPYKDPVKAGIMAALLPGLGHAYVHRYKDAAMAFAVNSLFILAAWESFEEDHQVLGGMLLFVELGWYTGNIYSGVNVTHKHNRKVKKDFLQELKEHSKISLGVNQQGGLGLGLSFCF